MEGPNRKVIVNDDMANVLFINGQEEGTAPGLHIAALKVQPLQGDMYLLVDAILGRRENFDPEKHLGRIHVWKDFIFGEELENVRLHRFEQPPEITIWDYIIPGLSKGCPRCNGLHEDHVAQVNRSSTKWLLLKCPITNQPYILKEDTDVEVNAHFAPLQKKEA
jgi:hypothetical protein